MIRQIVGISIITMMLGVIFTTTAIADQIPPPAPVIESPSLGYAGYAIEVTLIIDNTAEEFLLYDLQFGDGEFERGSVWETGILVLEFTHVWENPGSYNMTAQVCSCDTGLCSEITVKPITIVVGVPAPVIECQQRGFAGQQIEVTLIIDNSLGHNLIYDLQFGDGEFERGQTYEPGIVELVFTHVWENPGIYIMTAQIGDTTIGLVSEITEKPIRIFELLAAKVFTPIP